jgi:hypothetical protein
MDYTRPVVRDYGSLADITEAAAAGPLEDGGSKATILHHSPLPSEPAGA